MSALEECKLTCFDTRSLVEARDWKRWRQEVLEAARKNADTVYKVLTSHIEVLKEDVTSAGLSLITHFSYICDSDQNYDKYITSSEYRKSPNSSRNLIINNSLARNGFSSEYHIQMYMLEGVMTDLIKPYIIPSDIDIEPSSLSPPPRKNQD